VREVLQLMPVRQVGKSRVDAILYTLDICISGPCEGIDKGIGRSYTGDSDEFAQL
jgi:hypothetical protein